MRSMLVLQLAPNTQQPLSAKPEHEYWLTSSQEPSVGGFMPRQVAQSESALQASCSVVQSGSPLPLVAASALGGIRVTPERSKRVLLVRFSPRLSVATLYSVYEAPILGGLCCADGTRNTRRRAIAEVAEGSS